MATYEIAGVTMSLEPTRADLEMLLPPTFELFASDCDPGAAALRIRLDEDMVLEAEPLRFFLPYHFELQEGREWGEGHGYSFVNLLEQAVQLGSVYPAEGEACLRLPPVRSEWDDVETSSAVTMVLSDFIKTCLQTALLERGGTILHASGMEWGGKGGIFFGPSGAGKSTSARLLEKEGVNVLNDDVVAVTREKKGAAIHATPWVGTKGGRCGPGRAPLSGIFRLRREEASRLDKMEKKEALQELLANLPWLGESERLNSDTIAVAAWLADTVPVYELSFTLEKGPWGLISWMME